jgi:hypothetical protein
VWALGCGRLLLAGTSHLNQRRRSALLVALALLQHDADYILRQRRVLEKSAQVLDFLVVCSRHVKATDTETLLLVCKKQQK